MLGLIGVDLETGLWGSLTLGVFLVGALVLLVFGTTLTSALLGIVLLGVGLLLVYYVGVRVDQAARGGGSGGGSSRRGEY